MRFDKDGKPLRPVQIELPAELYRRLEEEKERSQRSFNSLLVEWLRPKLEALPPVSQTKGDEN